MSSVLNVDGIVLVAVCHGIPLRPESARLGLARFIKLKLKCVGNGKQRYQVVMGMGGLSQKYCHSSPSIVENGVGGSAW